ncbi:MAG: PepSY-associated TM helix domain-containing protein [Ferruginibacter sp.]
MKKPLLLRIHSWAGLGAGIFLFLLSVSGTLLVFRETLDSFQKPGISKSAGTAITVDSCRKILQQKYPKAEISSCQLPAGKQPFSFFVYDSSLNRFQQAREIFIDPVTGNISGIRGGSEDIRHNFMGWLSKFHSTFHAGKTGEWLLGVIAIFFVLGIVTGLVLYRENILNVLLFRKHAWNRKNLHQLIGVYALLFNLMWGVSGYWMQRYVFKKDFYTVSAWNKTSKPSPALSFSFDSALNQVKKQYPAFTAYVVYFAQSNKGKTAVYGSNSTNGFIHSKKFADVIALDSAGAIVSTRFVNENTPGDYYDIVNSQLHMGKYGGWPVKLLYGVFGITAALLSITGFLLWRKRKSGTV